MIERFNQRDRILIAVCIAIAAASLFVIYNWFYSAFPEASIEFKYDRDSSLPIAQRVIDAQRIDTRELKHAALFTGDETAKIFLERTVGLSKANQMMRSQVRLWWWLHRWFKPLQEEEFAVDVA
ncbi:MAG TPA: hypothetical protein VJ853_12135, partial [Thermoanaerobaculia bacterium]|nr:hypothetical protein [Thermoanaerobaculia bacterium]